jgi:hypothetical protein
LIPHLEHLYQQTNTHVANAKKAQSRSFLSATKKWLSGSKNEPTQPIKHNPAEIAALLPLELLMRKAADLAFFLQYYDVAFSAYHALKKEFGDKSNKIFASTQV